MILASPQKSNMKLTASEGIQNSSCFLSEMTIPKSENSIEINGDFDPGAVIHMLIKSYNTYLSVYLCLLCVIYCAS